MNKPTLIEMCIHNGLMQIIPGDHLDVFIEIMDTYKDQNFDNCICICSIKNIKLFSLFRSIENNSIEIIKYLLQFGLVDTENNIKETPLHVAVRLGRNEIVEILLNCKADPNKRNVNWETPLHLAENIKIVELLLRYKADPNIEDINKETLIFHASRRGNKEIVELLLNNKADPTKENRKKETPLYWAARRIHKEIVELLLRYKADPNKEDNAHDTPLHWAAYYGRGEIVELLLKNGADPNKEDNNKRTSMHIAVYQGNKEIVEILLRYKADPNKEDFHKITPIELAASKGNKNIVEILYKVVDEKYKSYPEILKCIKNANIKLTTQINSCFILQGYEFDENSLLSKDYLCRDLMFLLLKKAKHEKLLAKFNKCMN